MADYEITDVLDITKKGRGLQKLLGSFWSNVYENRSLIRQLCEVRNLVSAKRYQRIQEMLNSFSITSIPVTRTLSFRYLEFDSADQFTPDRDFYWLYGPNNDLVYNGGGIYGLRRNQYVGYSLPVSEITSIGAIVPSLSNPDYVLYENIDYVVEAGNIVFWSDPLLRDGTSTSSSGSSTKFYLWGVGIEEDHEDLNRQYGYYLGLEGTTEYARILMEKVYDMMQGEASMEATRIMAAAIAGIDLSKEEETIVAVDVTDVRTVVETDKNIYLYPAGTTPIVAVGDMVEQHAELVDTVRVYQSDDLPSSIYAIGLGPSFLGTGFIDSLNFLNTQQPVTYHGELNGYPRHRFPVGGYDEDVLNFWRRVENRAPEYGTLEDVFIYNYGRVPTTVNPAEFIYDVIRTNLFIIELKPLQFRDDAPGLSSLKMLDALIPAHTTYWIVSEVPLDGDETGWTDDGTPSLHHGEVLDADTLYGTTDLGARLA